MSRSPWAARTGLARSPTPRLKEEDHCGGGSRHGKGNRGRAPQ
jgi:hypothetical protein